MNSIKRGRLVRLYSYVYGGKESKLIDHNVLKYSISSGIDACSIRRNYFDSDGVHFGWPIVNPKSLSYRVLKNSGENCYFYGYKFYDGENSIEIVKQAVQYSKYHFAQ